MTLPHPRIVLLGPTGVGKSSLGNRLFGISDYNDASAVCSQFCGWDFNSTSEEYEYAGHKFGVGHSTDSHTVETSWMVGHYLGDPNNPLITIIDSPGTGDTEGRDCSHGIALAEGIKRIGAIDAFMVLIKGTNPRFDIYLQEQINIYLNIFGRELWDNTIIEFTYWSHDKQSIKRRKKGRGGLNMKKQHKKWNEEFEKRFRLHNSIPTLFVDPVFDSEDAAEKEIKLNKENTDKLWRLLTEETTPYRCGKRCQAPSGFFAGQPWLLEDTAIQNKRPGARAGITWQIWFAGCDGTQTRSYNISHLDATNVKTILYQTIDSGTGDNRTAVISDDSKLLAGMEVEEEVEEKFKTIRVKLKSLTDEHFGSFFVENEKGTSLPGEVNKIIDGQWQEWGPWGDCSKPCIRGDEKPGSMVRVRGCIPPLHGGLNCSGDSTSEASCAHPPGETGEHLRQCSVDAVWGRWLEWSACNPKCVQQGGPVPTKSRHRPCIPEQFGGRNCIALVDEANANNEPGYAEEQNCENSPKCPTNAVLGPWTEWTACKKSCYPEDETPPQQKRVKTCVEATLSTDPALLLENSRVVTCAKLGEAAEYRFCSISKCPVSARWQPWSDWSKCTDSCGPDATREKSRSFVEGRHGAKAKPKGKEKQEENCSAAKPPIVPGGWPNCPSDAHYGPWGEWSPCAQTCYDERSQSPQKTRSKKCIEATLSSSADENKDVVACEDLPQFTQHEPCGTPLCQVPATWMEWTPWTGCTLHSIGKNCGPGSTRQKSRSYIEGRHGANKQPEKGNQTESQICSSETIPGWPTCPRPAYHGEWESWSPCSQSCTEEGSSTPTKRRNKKCVEAVRSSNEHLNKNLVTCDYLGKIEETKDCVTCEEEDFEEDENCELPHCKVDAKWKDWGSWTQCTVTCGTGFKQRDRTYLPGKHGGKEKPAGWGTTEGTEQEREKMDCNTNPCPVPAKWRWSDWTPCDIHCKRPDGYRGVQNRTNICTKGEPEHEYYNCNHPPGARSEIRACPGLQTCHRLTKIEALIPDFFEAGTGNDISLRMKNTATGEECETETLDTSWTNNFKRNSWERFSEKDHPKMFAPCNHFFNPKRGDLQFNFRSNGNDDLRLSTVYLLFGSNYHFTWTGDHKFNYNRNDDYWFNIS